MELRLGEKMSKKLIVGLGNPGDKYALTRHNIGFMLVDRVANTLGLEWENNKKANAQVAVGSDVILVKPQTFMNRSGDCVSWLMSFYGAALDELVVLHDDVDLEFGETKFKKSAGSAGHKGVNDIIEKLGSKDFWRFRVGVGRPENNKFDVYDFVLSKMTDEELKFLETVDLTFLT